MKLDPVRLRGSYSLILLLLTLFFIQACATEYGAPRGRAGMGDRPARGRLGDAMNKASDSHKGPRVVEVNPGGGFDFPPPIVPEVMARVEVGISPPDGTPPPEIPKPDPKVFEPVKEWSVLGPLGLSGGVGLMKSDDFSALTAFDFSLGASDKESRLEIYFGGAWAGIAQTSKLGDSINDGVSLLNVGINFKKKLSSEPRWDTPYILFGGAYTRMLWRYKNEIVTTDGERISNDDLEGLEMHAGLGKNLFTINGTRVGIEVYPSVIFWGELTNRGFTNDVFDPFVMLNIRMVVSNW